MPLPVFYKARSIFFACIIVVCLVWIVLFSVDLFARWDSIDVFDRSLISIFILTDTITVIMLPILLILHFRVWLDAARLFFLLTIHISSAGVFTSQQMSPVQGCFSKESNELAICKVMSTLTLVACWMVPALLILYAGFLSCVVCLSSRLNESDVEPDTILENKKKDASHHASLLPLMGPIPDLIMPSEPNNVQRYTTKHWSVPITPTNPSIYSMDSHRPSRSFLPQPPPFVALPPRLHPPSTVPGSRLHEPITVPSTFAGSSTTEAASFAVGQRSRV